MTTKILVAGDVNGDFAALFGRVGTLHATKGPFDCLIVTGDFFGSSKPAAVADIPKPPLRTYILGHAPEGSAAPDQDGKVELAEDLFCLHGAGIVTLHALRVAFASTLRAASALRAITNASLARRASR